MTYNELILHLLGYDKNEFTITYEKVHYFDPSWGSLYKITSNDIELNHWISEDEYSRIIQQNRENNLNFKNEIVKYHKWMVGDFCFHNCNLSNIIEMFNDRVIGVETGGFGSNLSGSDLECFEVNRNNFYISGKYNFYRNLLYDLEMNSGDNLRFNESEIIDLIYEKYNNEIKTGEECDLSELYKTCEESVKTRVNNKIEGIDILKSVSMNEMRVT